VELSGDPAALSDLIGMPLVDASGRKLGRVYEVRAHWSKDGTIVFDELLLGRRGLMRRLHGPAPRSPGIPWEAVAEIGEERIVARGFGV
jgi:sporulation protein YlmC with PRC-barrel domain